MTDNMSLGIGIVHCITKANGAGFDVVYKSSEGNWAGLIDDTGDVFRHIKVNNGAIIRMIKFTADGWYLCSMKQIAGRDEEYRASWIFFPTNIDVSPKEITTIMEEVERNILKKDYNSTALDNIVDRYNNTSSDSPKYAVSHKQGDYAIRFVGGGNLSLFDIFGKIYQKTFTQYAWVILMTNEDAEIKDSVEDITSLRLHSSYIIQPPVGEMYGFEPFIGNTIFSKPVRISDNETLSIVWKLNGFLEISKTGNRPEDFIVNVSEIYRIIRPSQIKIFDENGRQLRTNASVNFIPGEWNEQNRVWLIPERNIANVVINVVAKGYDSTPIKKINLSDKAVNDEIIITLREESHTYRFKVCLDKNQHIYTPEFTLSYRERLTSCPFHGYKVQNGSLREDMLNTLIIDEKHYRDKYASTQTYNGQGWNRNEDNEYRGGYRTPEPEETFWDRWGNIILVCLIGLVVVPICFGVYWFFFKEEDRKSHNDYYTEDYTSKVDKTTNDVKALDYSKAKEYLNTAAKFKKTEMDSIIGLTGLWDMLNKYEFDKIKIHVSQHPELKESKRFQDLLNLFDKNPAITGSFCGENDYEITVSRYTSKINDALNKKTNVVNQGQDSKPNNTGTQEPKPKTNGKSTDKVNSQTSADNS